MKRSEVSPSLPLSPAAGAAQPHSAPAARQAGAAAGQPAPQTPGELSAAAPPGHAAWRLTIPAAALIVAAAVAAYHHSFAGPFVYDDLGAIVANQTIRQLWPLGQVLSPPPHGQTVSGRPLLNLSLAINYAIGGLDVRGYHVTNLLIHVAAALLLFGILRRTFLLPALCDRFGSAAVGLALASALLWTVHPLQTESVTYVVQRGESLMGFFYLLTLYCIIRGAAGTVPFFAGHKPTMPGSAAGEKGDCPPRSADEGPAARGERGGTNLANHRSQAGDYPPWPALLWYAAAVLACLLGMACKEVMATAPLIVLLYDRTFLAGSLAEGWRRRWGLYVGLAATWGLLAYLAFSTGLIARQAEVGAPDPWSYARSQPGVILHYLRLSLWPSPLCLDYAWPVARGFAEILPGALVIGVLVAATVWGLWGRRAWGFWGAWFFLLLAPTSSILPLTKLAFEHRMYLSLAAVAVLAATGGYVLWDRLLPRPAAPSYRALAARWAAPAVVVTALLFGLGVATAARNLDYASSLGIWQDTVDKRPDNPLAHYNLGTVLDGLGRSREAVVHYQRALELKPDYPEPHNNLGVILAAEGKFHEAIEHYRQALRLRPDDVEAHNNLGNALAAVGETEEAIKHCREAVRLRPDYAEAHGNLGVSLAAAGRFQEAFEHYRQALRLKPEHAQTHNNFANALAAVGRTEEAIEHFREALRLKPDYVEAHSNLGVSLAAAGRFDEAVEHYRRALRLKPDHVETYNNLGSAFAAVGRTAEAIEYYQQALRLKPDYAEAHNNLANALAAAGRVDEAIAHGRQALRLKPRYVEAYNNLGLALAAQGRMAEAIEQYQQALQLKPDYAAAHNNLANALVDAGRPDEAIEHYRQALRLNPDYVDAHCNLGLALAAGGKTDEAIEHYRTALRLQPNHASARYNLASALAHSGRTSEAIEHYNQLLQLLPDSFEALNDLAWLLASREAAQGGDPTRAVQLAQRARQLGGQENAHCLDTLAAAYAAAGRFADAVLAAERAAELAESSGQAALAKKIRLRLELYRSEQPYREGTRSTEQPEP
jgi:tetratricopeptide (TPR) repeat protein